MARVSTRHEFNRTTTAALAKRSGFQCAICQAVTVGPSAESPHSITNIGVAAHITAAAPGGPRYDTSLTSAERSGIGNGIWLCQNHAKLIDDDHATWTVAKLYDIKSRHEAYISRSLGMPRSIAATVVDVPDYSRGPSITPKEYAFVSVGSLVGAYRSVITPILRDRALTKDAELGVLMCGSPPEDDSSQSQETPWTAFVNADWLRWYLNAQRIGYKAAQEVPAKQIYGLIPAWPDSFFEFLNAIVLTNTTFEWQRHPDGYLMLAQHKMTGSAYNSSIEMKLSASLTRRTGSTRPSIREISTLSAGTGSCCFVNVAGSRALALRQSQPCRHDLFK